MKTDAYLDTWVISNKNDCTKMSEEETMRGGMVDLNSFLIYSLCEEKRLFSSVLFVGCQTRVGYAPLCLSVLQQGGSPSYTLDTGSYRMGKA